MAEAAQQEGTPSLAEQWALNSEQNEEVGENSNVKEEAPTEEVDSKQSELSDDATIAAVEEKEEEEAAPPEAPAPVAEEVNEASETSEEEEAAEEAPVVKIETAPADFRFPTTNQTRHCFTRYVEYHRCINAKGEGAPECDKFAKYYRSLCPSEWVERWNEQRENGTFPGPL